MRNIDVSKLDLKESIVNIRRVTKVVKGGKNSRFSVTVVVGDSDGHVGLGLGKSVEIPEAVRKASEDAKKSLITSRWSERPSPTRLWAYSEQARS